MKLLKSFIKVFISTRPNIVYCFDSSWNLIMWTGDNLSIIKVHKAVSLKNDISWRNYSSSLFKWRRGVVVITTAQLHSTKPELRFCAGSNPARGVSEIRDGEDLWQWSRLEIRLIAFRQSIIPQKQFIIIIIIMIIIIIKCMLLPNLL